MTALELINLTSGYAARPSFTGFRCRSLPAILALVGKNGMGKSSLLKTILSFLPAWDARSASTDAM
jgi:urea transport system ATP-binding protein